MIYFLVEAAVKQVYNVIGYRMSESESLPLGMLGNPRMKHLSYKFST